MLDEKSMAGLLNIPPRTLGRYRRHGRLPNCWIRNVHTYRPPVNTGNYHTLSNIILIQMTRGVTIRHWAKPVRLIDNGAGHLCGVEFEHTRDDNGVLTGTRETFALAADMAFKAIGQAFDPGALNGSGEAIKLAGGRIAVDVERRTGLAGVWAGGDCIAGGEDLTVAAVEDGKVAAESIHMALST